MDIDELLENTPRDFLLGTGLNIFAISTEPGMTPSPGTTQHIIVAPNERDAVEILQQRNDQLCMIMSNIKGRDINSTDAFKARGYVNIQPGFYSTRDRALRFMVEPLQKPGHHYKGFDITFTTGPSLDDQLCAQLKPGYIAELTPPINTGPMRR